MGVLRPGARGIPALPPGVFRTASSRTWPQQDQPREGCLPDCGLVQARPAGRASVYSLAQPALAGLLAAAETILAATGNAGALCPVYGQGQ